MRQLIYGIFHHEKDAEKAVRRFLDLDFSVDDITVIMKEGTIATEIPITHKSGVKEGMAIGAALGTVGVSLVSAGFGFFAAGPLAAAIQGAIAGGIAGASLGGLGGLGYWNDRVEFPKDHIENGSVLVGVLTENRAAEAQEVLEQGGGTEIMVRPPADAAEELRHEVL